MNFKLTKRRILRAVLSCSLFLSVSFSAGAQESVTLTVEDAVEYALQNSRTLKSSDIDLEIKKRGALEGWNVLLPSVQVSGTMSRATEYNPAMMMGGKTDFDDEEERWSVIGGLSVGWNFSFAYIQQIRASRASYEAQKITYDQALQETELNVRKLFYGLLLQKESLNIQHTTLENARNRAEQAETNYKNGSIPELSLLQTQVNYENMKPDVEQAERSFRQSIDMFAFILGLPVGTDIQLDGKIEPVYVDVDYEELLNEYGAQSLALKSLDRNINILELNLSALNLSRFTPALVLNYAWQPVYIGDGAFGFTGDIGSDDKWYDSGNLSLTLAWNLTNMLPFSQTGQQAADLKSTLNQLKINREILTENQKIEVRKAVDTLRESRAQIDAMGRNINLAQRAYDATLRAYRSGTTELLDLRDAESSLNQAKLGQMNQKFNYITALLDLENTLNTKLIK